MYTILTFFFFLDTQVRVLLRETDTAVIKDNLFIANTGSIVSLLGRFLFSNNIVHGIHQFFFSVSSSNITSNTVFLLLILFSGTFKSNYNFKFENIFIETGYLVQISSVNDNIDSLPNEFSNNVFRNITISNVFSLFFSFCYLFSNIPFSFRTTAMHK